MSQPNVRGEGKDERIIRIKSLEGRKRREDLVDGDW